MSYHKDFATASELTVEARAAAADLTDQSPIAALLPDVEVEDTQFSISRGALAGVPAAVYREHDTEAPYGRERAGEEFVGNLPPISQKLMLSEYSQLQLRGASNEAIKDALLAKANSLGKAIAARQILARGQVLTTGKMTINGENNLKFEVDFQRAAGLTTTATAPWTTAVTDAVTSINTLIALYAAQNGGAVPDTIVTTSNVISALGRNTAFIGASGSNATVLLPGMVTEVLRMFGFNRVVIEDSVIPVLNDDGTETPTRVIPTDSVILTGSSLLDGSQVGRNLWGVPAEAFQAEYGITSSLSGIAALARRRQDPEGIFVNASAIAMPVLDRANSTLHAKVG